MVTNPTLTAATLNVRSNDFVATWTIEGEMPTRGSWLLSTTVTGGEDGPIHQLGAKVVDNKLSAFFIFDYVEGRQHNYPGSPQRVGDTWTAVFPVAAVAPATSGTWKATLNLAGVDVGTVEGVLAPPS